jgi:signal transduction histidine kinase
VWATRGFPAPLVGPGELARVTGPTLVDRQVAGVASGARLLVLPLRTSGPAAFLVVGVSTSDRRDALHELVGVLVVGGSAAVALACLAAWFVAGWALRPVDRMQQQAAAITASGLDQRMPVPRTRDELHRLARTLNDMLDRLDRSLTAERRFHQRASHELRTPLAALRAEVDLALRRRRTVAELTTALRNVSDETDRLARLAEDLLVLARAEDGRLPLHREATDLPQLVESAAALFAGRAAESEVSLEVSTAAVTAGATVEVDPLRLRQLVDNLLDNALRHTPRGGTVRVAATIDDDTVRITVTDTGPGFPAAPASTGRASGLGLRIVRTIAAGHGGRVRTGAAPEGGAQVDVILPGTGRPAARHRT